MKRITSLVLTFVLLVACFALPVMADEITESGWVDLFDYYFGDTSFYASGYTSAIPLPSEGSVFDVEVLFYVNGYVESFSLNNGQSNFVGELTYMGDNVYLARFNLSGIYSGSFTFITEYASGNYGKILSVKYRSLGSSIYHTLSAHLLLSVALGETYEADYIGDYLPVQWNMAASTYDDRVFQANLYPTTDSLDYDFVDVNLILNVEDIESISVTDGLRPLPFEINSIYQATANFPGHPNTLVSLRIDVRGLEEGDYPIIRLTGYCHASSNQLIISYVGGVTVLEPPSPLAFWFTNLQGWLTSGFSSVTSSLSSLGSSISGYISDQTTSITNSFTSLQSHITDRFNDLRGWVNSGYMTMTLYIQTWGQNISNTITSGVDRIVSALSPSGSANDFNDKVQQQGSELENMAGAMNSVTRPDVSTAIPDIGGYLTVSGPVTLAAVFDPFWKNSYILRLLLGSLAVSVAFTVVYGGKK